MWWKRQVSEEVQFSLILNVEGALDNANKLNTILVKSGNIVRKMTGKDENIQTAIRNAQQLIGKLNRARVIAVSIQNAMMLGLGTPAGVIAAALAGISTAEYAIDIATEYGNDQIHDATWGT